MKYVGMLDEIEAVEVADILAVSRLYPPNWERLPPWVNAARKAGQLPFIKEDFIVLATDSGQTTGKKNDYLVRSAQGRLSVYPAAEFHFKYTAIKESTA